MCVLDTKLNARGAHNLPAEIGRVRQTFHKSISFKSPGILEPNTLINDKLV